MIEVKPELVRDTDKWVIDNKGFVLYIDLLSSDSEVTRVYDLMEEEITTARNNRAYFNSQLSRLRDKKVSTEKACMVVIDRHLDSLISVQILLKS